MIFFKKIKVFSQISTHLKSRDSFVKKKSFFIGLSNLGFLFNKNFVRFTLIRNFVLLFKLSKFKKNIYFLTRNKIFKCDFFGLSSSCRLQLKKKPFLLSFFVKQDLINECKKKNIFVVHF